MITEDKMLFHFVYPSWAKLSWPWDDLTQAFKDPFGFGGLTDEPKWLRTGYRHSLDSFTFIEGPSGNGIIQGSSLVQWNYVKYFWILVLMFELKIFDTWFKK